MTLVIGKIINLHIQINEWFMESILQPNKHIPHIERISGGWLYTRSFTECYIWIAGLNFYQSYTE